MAPQVDDVVDEVFGRLVTGDLSRFQGRSSVATWLAVVTRRCAERLASERRRTVPLSDDVTSTSLDPGALAEVSDTQRAVQECLGALTPRDQLALRLFYEDGRSYQEIARALSMPVTQVGSLLVRARKRVATALGLRLE